MKDISAVILDVDGTMLDTLGELPNQIRDILVEMGYTLPKDFTKWYFANIDGTRYDVIYAQLQEKLGIKEDLEIFGAIFHEKRKTLFKTNPPKAKQGLLELLEFLKNQKLKTAICSSSRIDMIQKKFEAAGLSLDDFDAVVDGNKVKNPKPAPEAYILTCAELGIDPKNVLVLEDSDPGILSAVGAGCRTILIPDITHNDPKVKKLAFKTVSSLDQIIPILKEGL